MPRSTAHKGRKSAGRLPVLGLILIALFVAALYVVGLVQQARGKAAPPPKETVTVVKGQIQPPLPGKPKAAGPENP